MFESNRIALALPARIFGFQERAQVRARLECPGWGSGQAFQQFCCRGFIFSCYWLKAPSI